MAVTKNALMRYLILDRCISNQSRKYTWQDLQKEVNAKLELEGIPGIGKTQLFDDIKFLINSDYQAPIVKIKEGKLSYYRYEIEDFSITKNPLSQNEISNIHNAIEVLISIGGIRQFDWVNDVVVKLETKLGLQTSQNEFISFQHNEDYVGLNFLNTFINAIKEQRVLKIIYQDFKSDEPYEIIFHPYYLKQFNNRWYAIGLNTAENISTWNIAFDRIKHVSESIKDVYQKSTIDFEDYFSDFVGVTKLSNQVEEVKLLILDELQSKYIETNPIHQTQRQIRKTDQGFETSIYVILNYELEKLLLSFGEKIKVLSPETLVQKMKNHYLDAVNLYSDLP